MTKHWGVLRNDKILGSVLPYRPQVIFRGVPPLKLQVAPNILDAPNRVSSFQKSKGYFPCRNCNACLCNKNKEIKICHFKSNVTGRSYGIHTYYVYLFKRGISLDLSLWHIVRGTYYRSYEC